MHDLLRAYARELAAAEDGARPAEQAALTSLFDYYLGVAASAMDVLVPAERHYRPRLEPIGTPAPELADPGPGARLARRRTRRPGRGRRCTPPPTAGPVTPPGWPPSCTATWRPAATTPTR